MKETRIVLIVECLEKGVGKHVTDLYKNLKKNKNLDIKIIYAEKRADPNFVNLIDKKDRILVKHLQRKIGINDIKSIFELKKILKEINPSVVHCHSSKAGLAGRIASKMLNIKKIIYSPHAYFFLKYNEHSIKRKIFIFAEKILSRYCTTYTITTSKGENEAFEKYKIDCLSKKILIEHGLEKPIVDVNGRSNIRSKYCINDNTIFVGAMARFENQKDPKGTYEIMKRISEKRNDVKCIFWGDGSEYEEIKKINEKNSNIIILPGATDNPDVNLNSLDIYITASLYEGLPYTLLESLSLGKPIVASNVEGNKDCVINNKNGLLFEPKCYDEAVEKIEFIIAEKKMEEYGKNSLEIFNKRFSMKTMINNYERLYLGE